MTDNKKDAEPIIAYKGFNADWTCRGFKYELGKIYEHDGDVTICKSGFHACEYPLDVFGYYPPSEAKFAVVEMHGKCLRHESDSKLASAKIEIKAEIGIPEMVNRAVNWIMAKIDTTSAENKDQSAATNTGYQSAATNTGSWSTATNTGNRSAATNTGDQSAATNTGGQSAATNTGYQSAATNTGNRSAATNTGYRSAATNTGSWSAATNTGDQSAATNTGYQSAADVSGKDSVAIATGYQSKAKASEGGAIVLCYRNDEGELIHIRASKVGENGVKPETWYLLDEQGEFVEVND